jgi:membrane protease YdiL (CAAX protease family)
MKPYLLLWLEFLVVFAALPLAWSLAPWYMPKAPMLWIIAGLCTLVLWRDPTFPGIRLWHQGELKRHLPPVLKRFVALGVLLAIATAWLQPGTLFGFVRQKPLVWALVMILYPLLSVYPQGIVFRAFIVHRYQHMFRDPRLVIALSALAFAWVHIVFRNPVAPVLTLFGGAMFATTYVRTGSLLLSNLEHAMYGCWLFTLGLGRYFYDGG